MTSAVDPPRPSASFATAFALGLLVVELSAIGLVFKHAIDFNCLVNWPAWACRGGSGTLIAFYCMLGALALLTMLRPAPLRDLTAEAGTRLWPLAINAAGVGIAFVPTVLLQEGSGAQALGLAFAFWSLGMLLLLSGLLRYVAPPSLWRDYLSDQWQIVLPVMLAAAATPYLSTLIRPLWRLETTTDLTFGAVVWLIGAMGYDVETGTENKAIGSGDFFIGVAPVCSGIEGIALVTLFVSLYLWLFRQELRFPRSLLLYPIGIAASAIFNVIRITALLAIGLEGNPELAVGGFHSHAGWLMFTFVSLGIIALAQNVPALKKYNAVASASPAAGGSLWQDPVAARILPFAVFMLGALAVSAFSQVPGAMYPFRVLVLAAFLLPFLPIYRRLHWRIDPVAIGVGCAIGVMWVLIPVAPSETAPFGAVSGGLLLAWFVFRGIGTIILVPIVEELFFRDYLESRLRLGQGHAWAILAACVTAGLFALLHDRWIEAFVAGLAFSAVMRRNGNITDAILAHATANAIVFAVAVATGNLAII